MKRVPAFLMFFVAFGLLAGCAEDKGTPPPDRKPVSEEQIKQMPPEAQQAAQNAARAGDVQSKRMQEMADAQKRSQGGK